MNCFLSHRNSVLPLQGLSLPLPPFRHSIPDRLRRLRRLVSLRVPSPEYSFPTAAWTPARTGLGEMVLQNAQQLTRDQRLVLALVNGQRTTHEIADLLGFPVEAVHELLVYFRDQKLIF
jgi:DNA-directed RNA polymerase specialized sigma24 family protein